MTTRVEAFLVVPASGKGGFRAEGAGRTCDGETSRIARTRFAHALRAALGPGVRIEWTLHLPEPIALELGNYRAQVAGMAPAERRSLDGRRVAIARQLLECRLSASEAAGALGITPAWLGRLLSQARTVVEGLGVRGC